MRNRALRPLATILSLLLVASTPVQAGPITISQVVQVLGGYQNTGRVPELRLRNVLQSPSTPVSDEVRSSAAGAQSPTDAQSPARPDAGTVGAAPISSDSLLAGVAVTSDDPQSRVDVISQGNLEGSICDCGEIPPEVSHHFPKWPLLFLAAIPFFFIHHHCDTCNVPTSTPTPETTPTPPPQIPEPASLLLFGSGLAALGAGLRRRYARGKLDKEVATATEGQ